MKKQIILILLLTQLGANAQVSDANQFQIDIDKLETTEVSIDLYRGVIKISRGESNTILVSQRVIDYDAYLKGNLVFMNNRIRSTARLDIAKSDNKVEISNSSERNIVELEIILPEVSTLTLAINHFGSIRIDNVQADLDISIYQGEIIMQNNVGSVSASVIRDGNINLATSPLEKSIYVLSTYDGDITVQIPSQAKASFSVNNDMGSVNNRLFNFSETDSIQYNMNIKGQMKSALSYWYKGALNGGGANFIIRNTKGKVEIK